MTLVIDASVASKWFIGEPDSPDARAILASGESLIAPDLIVAEACNVVWKKRRLGQMTPDQASAMVGALPGFFDALISGEHLAARALTIAESLAHPVYDCFYLALAEQVGAALVTADARFLQRLRGTPWQARVVRLSGPLP